MAMIQSELGKVEPIDLSAVEHRVIGAMYELWGDEYAGGFDPIAAHAGLSIDQVRAACRSLRAKGLTHFLRGLMTEEGELAGAGYGLTRKAFAHGWLEGDALRELERQEAAAQATV